MQTKFKHLDAVPSMLFSREAEKIRAKNYEVQRQALRAMQFIPYDTETAGSFDAEVTYRMFDMVGSAKIISDWGKDLPRVDVFGTETTGKIKDIGAAYGWSLMEARRVGAGGRPLSPARAAAAKRAIEEEIDRILRVGDSAHGLVGFFNQPNTTTYSVPNGVGGSPTWALKTSYEILADMNGMVTAIISSTKEIWAPDTMLLPTDQYRLVATKPMQDGNSATVLEYFLKSNPGFKVMSWSALDGAGAGPTDLAICYKYDPDVLKAVVPQPFEQLPMAEKNDGLEFEVPCLARCGGVECTYPLAICFATGI